MPKFRKKPVVIEAVQWNGTNHLITETFMKGSGAYLDRDASPLGVIKIPTLEGVMDARVDDWIIKGVSGEFYPIKEPIFLLTYEPVDDALPS